MIELSKTQKGIQKAAAEFAKGEFDSDQARELEKGLEFPKTLWKKAADLGFVGMHLPEEAGGAGLGLLEQVLVDEVFCMQDPSLGLALSLAGHGPEALLKSENGDKNAFLSDFAAGEILSAFCWQMLEKNLQLGSDKEERVLVDQVLNPYPADKFLLPWLGDEGESGSEPGIFVLAADRVEIKPGLAKGFLGLNLIGPGQVEFRLWDLKKAQFFHLRKMASLRQYLETLFLLRIAGVCLGLAQGAYDRTLGYARSREQFGRPILAFKTIQHKLAKMRASLTQSRLMVYKGAELFDGGGLKLQEAALIKMQAANTARGIGDEGVQILGGYGYMKEYDLERYYREAKACEILGGSARKQLEILASDIVKKSRLKRG